MVGGIDLGGTKIQTIVMRDEDHRVLGQARSLTPARGRPGGGGGRARGVHVRGGRRGERRNRALEGIGVGAPGEVDAAAGTLARATNLSEWERPYPLAAMLSSASARA